MKYFSLANAYNQKFTTTLNGSVVRLIFRTFHDVLFADIEINGEYECCGVVVSPNKSLFPSSVNTVIGGTLQFDVIGDIEVRHDTINDATCRLVYREF